MKETRLVIVDDNGNDAEWRIGYVDNKPAVGDSAGRWYFVPQDAIIPQSSQQLVWMLQDSEWSCIHQMHWDPRQTPPSLPDKWLTEGPAYVEP